MTDYLTTELIVRVIASFIASLGFAIILRVDPKHIVYGAAVGTATYVIYYTVLYFGGGLFAAGFISTTFTALFAEILARIRRAPSIVFLLPGVIPTVPGGDLYRAMRDLISGSIQSALSNFAAALNRALGIAGGIVTVSILFGIYLDSKKKFKSRKKN